MGIGRSGVAAGDLVLIESADCDANWPRRGSIR